MGPATPPYVELHCHSAYSFLDGVSLPDELAQRASELGHTALALTDHNSVSGSMELAQAALDHGIRAIHGAELDLSSGRHITLLVRDERGWRMLGGVLSHAHARHRAERQDVFVALPNHTTLDPSEPMPRGNPTHVMASPQAMASR